MTAKDLEKKITEAIKSEGLIVNREVCDAIDELIEVAQDETEFEREYANGDEP